MEPNIIKSFYSEPHQSGAGFTVFSGTRRQVGGSFLSGLSRFALPILKFIGSKVFNVAKGVASDVVIDRKPIGQSLKKRTIQEVTDTVSKSFSSRKRPSTKKQRGRGVIPPINKCKKRKVVDILGE